MDQIKAYSRRSFLFTMLFMAALAGMHLAIFFFILHPSMPSGLTPITLFGWAYTTPALYGCFMLFYGVLLWIFLKIVFANVMKTAQLKQTPAKAKKKQSSTANRERDENAQRRLLLHLISVLQREGRLLDFFSEDLSLYEDAQIGAAVRGIHENCKKTLDKYVRPNSVMSAHEGEAVEVPADFDKNMIRLTGNVVGEPPFKGVLRHRGWQARRMELPKLAETRDPLIIAPAEVEIQ